MQHHLFKFIADKMKVGIWGKYCRNVDALVFQTTTHQLKLLQSDWEKNISVQIIIVKGIT